MFQSLLPSKMPSAAGFDKMPGDAFRWRSRLGNSDQSEKSQNVMQNQCSPSTSVPTAQGIWIFCIAFLYGVFIVYPTT